MFAVAKDGRSVRFGLEVGGKQPVRFDLEQRRVEVDAPGDRALAIELGLEAFSPASGGRCGEA